MEEIGSEEEMESFVFEEEKCEVSWRSHWFFGWFSGFCFCYRR